MNDDKKIIIDFGLALIEIFGLIGVLFVWSQLLFNEINGKTIFLILSKPIKRYEFILGKFFGFSSVISMIVLFQSIILLGVMMFEGIEITKLIIFSLIFTLIKLEILIALVLLFSTFMSSILTIIVTLFVYLISHSFSTIIDTLVKKWAETILPFVQGFSTIFPPFEALNIKDSIWGIIEFSNTYLAMNFLYGLLYLAVIVFATIFLFNKKKFED